MLHWTCPKNILKNRGYNSLFFFNTSVPGFQGRHWTNDTGQWCVIILPSSPHQSARGFSIEKWRCYNTCMSNFEPTTQTTRHVFPDMPAFGKGKKKAVETAAIVAKVPAFIVLLHIYSTCSTSESLRLQHNPS